MRIKIFIFLIILFFVVNYVYALEGLVFTTSLNKQEYKTGDGLIWNYRLQNRDYFYTNVCFFLETQNNVYDITQLIVDKTNEQYCPHQNCVKLDNISIGSIPRAIEGTILRYDFADSFPEGDYSLITQLRKTEDKCSENGTVVNVIDSELFAKSINPFKYTSTINNCVKNYSCDSYLIFIPIPSSWTSQAFFEQKASDTAIFFKDISKFRDRKIGFVYIPIDYVNTSCDLAKFEIEIDTVKEPENFLKLKNCADKYTRSLGISYERAVGFSNLYGYRTRDNLLLLGLAYLDNKKVVWASRGKGIDMPGLVSHELGHTYNLCDEYSSFAYTAMDRELKLIGGCKNKFPSQCTSVEEIFGSACKGNTPACRDYSGNPPINGVCEGLVHYSVMGPAQTSACGYDNTGGYEAVGSIGPASENLCN
ncbi:hypothetical protein HYX19_02025 [Candidatus Woesearchaeota archaeon]|nr:hypothetical protein [Candidatus Woesearchaeota archaeon]